MEPHVRATAATELNAGGKTWLGHPPGLFLLFLVEMWERFSYYGMRGFLVLYLTTPETGMRLEMRPAGAAEGFNPGRGWDDGTASVLYGWYTGLVYLTPLIGGLIADRWIGTHRSMVTGGIIIALGHVLLAISGLGDLAHNTAGLSLFIGGLAMVVIGTGHFKPTVSVMVGQLYSPDDPRRDGAFTIFYMGINLGAFLCGFVCGTLAEKVGWHWGFGSAALGMLAGLTLYLLLRPRYLATVGLPPGDKGGRAPWFILTAFALSAVVAVAFHQGGLAWLNTALMRQMGRVPVIVLLAAAVLALVAWFLKLQRPEDRGPVATIFVFTFFNAFFWVAFEQAGSSINLFTDRHTDRFIGTFQVPTTWFQSINAGLIFILAPAFAVLWTALERRRRNPGQSVKIALGLLMLGIGFMFMAWAGFITRDGAPKAGMSLVVLTYFWHTVGELCLSPTGLAYVTKTAPMRFLSLLMGVWFISSFMANLAGGLIAAQVDKIAEGKIKLPWHFGGQADFYVLFVVTSIGAALLIFMLSPLLNRLGAPAGPPKNPPSDPSPPNA